MRQLFLLLPLLALIATSAHAQQQQENALHSQVFKIDSAYQIARLKRTVFDKNQSGAPPLEAEYLEYIFGYVDILVAERVQAMHAFTHGKLYNATSYRNYPVIINVLSSTQMPAALKPINDLIVSAAQDQLAYFQQWTKTGGVFNEHDPLVQSSHHKLLYAYGMLRVQYTKETRHNRDAFYDHLCAMDFI